METQLAQGVHQNRITQVSSPLPQNLVTTSLQLFFQILVLHCNVLLRIWQSSASNPKIAEQLVNQILGIHSSTKLNVLQYWVMVIQLL
jgi:hypothetical protein